MDVRLPDGTIIRGVPDGTTKAQLDAKLQANGIDTSAPAPAEEPAEEPGLLGELGRGVVRGTGTMVSGLARPLEELPEILLATSPLMYVPVLGDKIREGVQPAAEIYKKGVAPAADWLKEAGTDISESVAPRATPNLYGAWDKGGVSGALKSLAVTVSEGSAPMLGGALAGVLTKSPTAAMAVMAPTSAPQVYTGIRETQDQTGQDSIGAALAGTAVVTALDIFKGAGKAVSNLSLDAVKELFEQGLRSATKEVLETGASESGTEALQKVIEQVAGGADPTTKQSLLDTLEAGLAGLLGGTFFGSVSETTNKLAASRSRSVARGLPAPEDGATPLEDDIEAFIANPSKERHDALVSRYVNQYGFPEGEAIKAAQAALEMADVRQQEAAEAAAKLPTPEGDVGVTPTPGAAGQTTGDSTTSYVAPKVDRATAEQQVTETFNNVAYDFTEDGEPLSVAAREAAVQMVVDGQDPYDAVDRAVEAEREGTLAPVTPTPEAGTQQGDAGGITFETIPYDTVRFVEQGKPLEYSSGEAPIVDMSGRMVTVVNTGGVRVPFYLSTGSGGKATVQAGRWYPFFGIGADGWMNKTTEDEINDFYGSPKLREIAEHLDKTIGDIRNDTTIPKPKPTGSHIDFVNMGLTPSENHRPTTLTAVRANIDSIKARLAAQQAPPAGGATDNTFTSLEADLVAFETFSSRGAVAPAPLVRKIAEKLLDAQGKFDMNTPIVAQFAATYGAVLNEVAEAKAAKAATQQPPPAGGATTTVEQIQAGKTLKDRVSLANVALGDHLTTNAPTYSHVDPVVMTAATNVAAQRVANKKLKNDVDPVATLNKVLAKKGVSITPIPPVFEGADTLIPNAPLGTVLPVEGGTYGIKVADRPGATVPGQTVVTARSGVPLRTREAAQDFANEITPPPAADINLASSPEQTPTSVTTDQNRAVGAAQLPNPGTDISAALASGLVPTVDVPSRNPLEVDAKPRFDLEAYRKTNEAEDAARKVEEEAQAEQEKARIAGVAARYDRTRQDVNADLEFSRMDWFAAAGLHELKAAGEYYDGLAPSERMQKRMQLARDAGIVEEGKSPPQVQTVLRKPWAELSPEQRTTLAEGFGVSKAGVAARKKRVNRPWAELTPEEQAALTIAEPTGDTSAGKTATNAVVEEALVVDEALAARKAFGKALEEARSGAKITNEEYVSIRDSTGDQPKLLAAALDKKRVADDALVAENTKAKERHERAQMKLPASKRKPFVPKVGLAATASQAKGIGADPAPEEAARWQQLVEGKSLAEVADVLAAHGSPLTRFIAKRVAFLIRAMERLGVEFSFNVTHVGDVGIPRALVGARGVAIRTDHDMRVAVWVPGADVTGRVGTSEHILLHELIHAVTLSATNVGMYDRFANTALGVAVRDLIAVRTAIVGHFNKRAAEAEAGGRPLTEFEQAIFDGANYLQDKDEVLAWTMTDPHMRAYLEAIPYKGKSSLWSGFVRAVRILLGLSPAADTALSEVLRVGDILLSTNPKAVRNYISELFPDKPAGGTAAAVEETANQAMDATANASTTAEVAASIQAGANARTYNPFRGPLNRLMASASATHLKRLLGGIPTSGIVEHFKRVKVGDKWADFPELEQFNEEIDQLARGMKSKMVRAFTRMAKRYSKFVSEFGSRVIAAAMHNARAASFDVSTFNSLGDAYKNDPLMDYLTRALAQQNLSAEQTASFTAQRKKRIGEITKVWGNWVALGKQEGGQALYREVQQYYKDMYNLTRSALNANIRTRDIGEEYQDRLIEAATLDREKNPDYPDVPAELLPNVYFPYKRYGKFWARVTSKAKKDKKREFHTFESAAERDRFVETRATQLGIKDKAKDSGYFPIGNDISDLQAQNDFTANSKMLKAMFEIVDKATFKDTKGDALEGDALELAIKKLKDSLYQTYLLTLPERSIRKQFIHAEGIPGYSEDVMRNFTTTATAYANQLPKIKYGALLDRKTEEARGRVEGWPSDIRAKMETVISELSGRAYYTLNPPDQSGFVTFVNNAAFLFLLSSAATALVQTTSIPMRVLPNLVSRYGYKETFFMLAKYAPGWNTVGITETLPDGTVLHTAPTFVNAKLQGKKPVNGLDIAGAAKYMQDHDAFEENAVHATMENRKSEVSTSESVGRKAFAATMKALTASFSMAERMSREMTGLMAYELEFNKLVKGGMEAKAAHDMAAKSAVKSVHDTLGNYSAYERPRYLKGDLARFVMLFKMYAVNTTMFFVRNTKTILRNDPNITAKERVAAAHELAGVLLMSGVFSGMTGMPLYTTICAVIDALSDGDDDDDGDGVKDPYAASSADWRFRHLWLPRHFGAITLPGLDGKQHSLSSIAERGLVSELSGVNIASRTAYDNMWFRQGRPGDNMTETLQNYLFDNFSPGLSVGFNMVGAVEDWSKGDIIRGFEKISPALIKGGFTATRLGTEGSRTRAGDLMVDKEDIESFPLLMQVAGFQPTEVATAQQDRIKEDKLYKRKEDEREQLVREFTRARYGYDSTQEEILSAYEAMQEFSRKNAGDLDLIITADVLENSARSYLQRKNLTVNGRYVAPGQENFLRSERKEAQ